MRWIAILIAVSVIAACFYPWVTYKGGNVVEGFYSTNETWGKPGLIHVAMCSLFIILLLIGKLWSLRIAFFVSAINIAWALRNYFLIPACEGGECPVKHTAIYILLFGSILATIALLFSGARTKPSV